MVKAVLFDMDGVLFDTERMYLERLLLIMRDYGYEMTRAFFIGTLGVPVSACRDMYFRTYGEDFPYEAVYTRLFEDVRGYVKKHGTPLKAGAAECLRALKARGLSMALATSAPRFAVEDYFSALPEVDGLLLGKVCGDEVERGKPDPEIFQKAARLAGFDPSLCLGVEDSPSGLKAIRASGAHAVMIPDLLPYTDELKPYVDTVLQSIAALPPLIDSLNGTTQLTGRT